MWIMFVSIYFCDLKVGAKIANKSLTNINEFTVAVSVEILFE